MSQLFLFLMAVIIILATIYIGTRLVGSLTSVSCDVSDIEFQRSLRRELDGMGVYGSRGTVVLNAPCDAKQLCLIDTTSIGNQEFVSTHPTLTNAIRNGVKKNVFLVKKTGYADVTYDDRIAVATGEEVCVNVTRGAFRFSAEGFGRTIRVGP